MPAIFKETQKGGFQLSPIKAMELAASRVPGAISLAQGIPSFATPQVIRDYACSKIAEGACDKYSLTLGLSEFREEIALNLKKDGLSYDPESEIIATCGAAEAICAAVLACTEPGDEVLIPNPTYASYPNAVAMARCSAKYVALDEDRNFDFQIESIRKAISKRTRVILYCSPNNPTGTLFSEKATRELVDLALQHKITLITDEVYKDFYYTDDPHFSPASITEARDIVVRVCSLSKAFAMTGWRIGFMHSSAKRMQHILKYHDAMVTCAPLVSQYAAIAALRHGAEALKEFQTEFRRRRDYLITRLDRLSNVFDYQIPKATYFAFPRVKDTHPLAHQSQKLAYDILDKVKLALVPGIAFGPAGEAHLRISFGKELESLEQGFDRLEQYFSQKKNVESPLLAKQSATPPQNSFAQSLKQALLAQAARFYLHRFKPIIIGITGTRGKTVFKRVLSETLKTHFALRAGILSYNTQVGLPLSILGLEAPRTLSAKFLFGLKVLAKLLFGSPPERILIVEYGISSVKDAQDLAHIALPDWLVISSISQSDPGSNYAVIYEGLTAFCKKLPSDRILFNAEDSALKDLAKEWPAENALNLEEAGNLKISDQSLQLVGESASLAALASNKLLAKLSKN